MTEQTLPPTLGVRTRRWPALLAGLVVGAGAAFAAFTILENDDSNAEGATDAGVALTTAPVTVADLIEEVDWVGDLTYGADVEISAPSDGTVTAVSAAGALLRRGDVIVEIDEQPVALWYGAIPAWRDLAEGDEGDDVRQLESNLVALGYDPDGTVTIDETYTSNTEAMVERWQLDVGLEETGRFSADAVVVVSGPVRVTTAPTVGDPARSGTALAAVSAVAETETVVTPTGGTITDLLPEGAPVEHGTVLFRLDGIDVVALHGLVVADGVDNVNEILPVLVSEGRQVSLHHIAEGTTVSDTVPALELSTPTLSVVVPVELAEQDEWAVDQPVAITLADDRSLAGRVTDVGTVAQGGGQGETPTIDVTIHFDDLVDDDLPASEVTVTVAGDSVLGATVVPTRALVTLAEGGFAVERVADDGTTVLVAVDTGAFDDGLVEIESSQLTPGDDVVVPS
ncbi:MAG: peptidoglycan-binding protein [Actinomycetota bacterium]